VSKWNWDHRKKQGLCTDRRAGQLNKSQMPGAKKREAKKEVKLDENGQKRGRGRPRLIKN
jgi:hypothetical protein